MPEANISPTTDDQSAAPEADADAVAAEESASAADTGASAAEESAPDADADASAAEETVPEADVDADAAEESGPEADADAEAPEAPEASGDDEPDARTADGDGADQEAVEEALAAQAAVQQDVREEAGEWAGETEEEDHLPPSRTGLSPRQARRVRVIFSAIVMTLVGLTLIVRLSIAPSVLTVGVYGFALSLFGGALVLSRRGRTRVATAVLAVGFVTVVLAEQLFATAH
jgi:hypothetical protein